MCKTKPNIFHTTSLNRDLHPNIHKGCMWRGPTDLPTDLRVRLELRSTFWNHEHTLTWFLPLPAFEGENTQPWTPLEEQEKKTARTAGPQISNVFRNTSDLDAVKHVKQRNHQIWLGRFKSLQFFQRINLHGLCPDLIFRHPFCSFR